MYDNRGDSVKAEQTLNDLPMLVDLSGAQMLYHTDVMGLRSLLRGWINAGKNLYALDSADLAVLETYTSKTSGIQNKVLPLLAINNQLSYLPPVYDPYASSNGSFNAISTGDKIRIETDDNELEHMEDVRLYNRFKLYPNPTQEYLNIDYQCKSNLDDTRIVVYGLDGRMIEQFALPTHKGQITIDVSAYRNGRYIASLQWKDFRLYETKFAVAR